VYIGSCTNGRNSDLRIAAGIVKGTKLAHGVRGIVSPATPAVFKQAMDEGLIAEFMDAGYCVTNPPAEHAWACPTACLPKAKCARQRQTAISTAGWERRMVHFDEPGQRRRKRHNGQLTDPRNI